MPAHTMAVSCKCQQGWDRTTAPVWGAHDPDAGLRDDAGAEDQIPGQRFALLLRGIARTAEQRFLLTVAVVGGA